MKKETLKIVISLFVFLGIVLVGNQVLADANSNPIFPTFEQVRQMIADALGQSLVLPPFTSEIIVDNSHISQNEEASRIELVLQSRLMDQNFEVWVDTGASWGIAHWPSGDRHCEGNLQQAVCFVPNADAPSDGTPVNVDIYTFYAGKTIHLNATITNWQ